MAKFTLPDVEREQLARWKEKDVLRRLIGRKDNPRGDFVFFEGPPTANGKPGIHHLLTRAFKDAILRYRTMRGHRIDRKAGWDTHGLPVELEVEKELGFTMKQQIEDYGIGKFNAKCKESVWKYLDLWRKSTERVGFWIDLDDPYITYANGYVESLWWILKDIDSRGLLYEGHRTTPHCPRCVTSLSSHELAQGYRDVEDTSAYVKFALAGENGRFFLAWTTTPWTLPANMALAVGADIDYVELKLKATGERLVLAKSRSAVIEEAHDMIAEMKGEELVGVAYEGLYGIGEDAGEGKVHTVHAGDFVSTEDGTGIVHIAPAYGEDDAELGRKAGLKPVMSAGADGIMAADVPGKGKFFKDADKEIIADLQTRGLLYKTEMYSHSYPHCWRCGTPLMYYAKASWYIRMSGLRDRLIGNNKDVNWVPAHIRDGRFGEWLRDVKDWALSRERYWGTPLPVWKCHDCSETRMIGGLEELDTHAPARNTYYLQRHGEAETNARDIISSWPEISPYPLTAKGRKQIEMRAEEYGKIGIDMIFASDLVRTRETAEIIGKALGLQVQYDPRLRELDVGVFNGRTEAEYRAQFRVPTDRFDQPSEGGETLRACRRRMIEVVRELEREHEGKRIILVSHGDPLWLLETGLQGKGDSEALEGPYNHTGEYRALELQRRPYDDDGNIDVHRPFIDDIWLKCGCGGRMGREKHVIDVWFDSGAMPFAQWHYPFSDKGRIDGGDGGRPTNFPADFISEAIDQTRGWFYTLLAVSTLLEKGPAYRNVICLGHVLDAKGQKMSKSKGNVVDPFAMMDRHGADAIRYYFFSVNQPGEPKRFDEKGLEEVTKKVFMILWNVLSFWKMYAGDGAAPSSRPAPGHALDRWVLAEFDALRARATAGLESYDIVGPARDVAAFINDLSTWYVRRSRDRFKNGTDREKEDAAATLGYVLRGLAQVMAPFTPFLADALYQETGGPEDSVHLSAWPDADTAADEGLREAMRSVRMAASAGLEKRASAGIPVRQALAKAEIVAPSDKEEWMLGLLCDELNVLEVVWTKGEELAVSLDTALTPGLRRMGAVRELVRHVNAARKSAGLTPTDRITLHFETSGAIWKEAMTEHKDAILRDVRADAIVEGLGGTEDVKALTVDGQDVRVAISTKV